MPTGRYQVDTNNEKGEMDEQKRDREKVYMGRGITYKA